MGWEYVVEQLGCRRATAYKHLRRCALEMGRDPGASGLLRVPERVWLRYHERHILRVAPPAPAPRPKKSPAPRPEKHASGGRGEGALPPISQPRHRLPPPAPLPPVSQPRHPRKPAELN